MNQEELYNKSGCRNLLLTILIIFLFIVMICLMSCSVYPEGQLTITKKYIGRVEQYQHLDKFTKVRTSEGIYYICGHIDIPDSVHCYIRYAPVYCDVHPVIKEQLQHQYFSWNGQEYRVKTW